MDIPGNLSLSATTGPVLGGTPIVITGGNLTGGSDRRCRFVPIVFGIPSRAGRRADCSWKRALRTQFGRSNNTPAAPCAASGGKPPASGAPIPS